MEVDCPSAFRLSCMWKSVALAWTLRSSTNVEEAVRSGCRSKDRRRGSKGCSAAAASVQKDAGSDFHSRIAQGGDEKCHKRSGSSI